MENPQLTNISEIMLVLSEQSGIVIDIFVKYQTKKVDNI